MAIAILTAMCISNVFFHVSSVPILQGSKRGSVKFRNWGKVVQQEDSKAGIQTRVFRRKNRIPTTCWWLQPTQRHLSWYVRREDSIMSYLGSELILLITCHLPAPHPGLVLLEEVPGDADQKLEWAVPTPSS